MSELTTGTGERARAESYVPGETLDFRRPWTDRLLDLMADGPGLPQTAEHIDRLATLLLAEVGALCARGGESAPTPIVVLRGGLLMLEAARNALGAAPWGFLLPAPRPRGGEVEIERADVPRAAPDGSHLLLDTIVNTGETVLASLERLRRLGVDTSSGSVRLACVFLTARGERLIRSRHPDLTIYTVRSGMDVGPDGWVVGLGFDAGDCAVGGGDRLQWHERTVRP